MSPSPYLLAAGDAAAHGCSTPQWHPRAGAQGGGGAGGARGRGERVLWGPAPQDGCGGCGCPPGCWGGSHSDTWMSRRAAARPRVWVSPAGCPPWPRTSGCWSASVPCSGWTPCSRYCPPLGTREWRVSPGCPSPACWSLGTYGEQPWGCTGRWAPRWLPVPLMPHLHMSPTCPHMSPCPSPAGAPPAAVPHPVACLVQHLGHAVPCAAPRPAHRGGHGRAGTGTGGHGDRLWWQPCHPPVLCRLSPRWFAPLPGARGLCRCSGWCWGPLLGSCSSPSSSSSCGR